MIWEIKPFPQNNFLEKFKDLPAILKILLWQRGYRTKQEIYEFLYPKFSYIYKNNPNKFFNFEKFLKLLLKIKKNKLKVCIYGDYDMDGIAGTIILKNVLDKLGIYTYVYIPSREEGYGLNFKAIDFLKKLGIDYIITIDCGSTDYKEIDYANKNNIKIVVIDHHIVLKSPNAELIINPNIKNDNYPFKELSASGVVFKICLGIEKSKFFKKFFPENFVENFIDFVCLATIADYRELVDENRVFVVYGLKKLLKYKRIGIKLLFESLKTDPFFEELDTEKIQYYIVPRINISGRIDHSNISYKLLTSSNITTAKKYAEKIEKLLEKRKKEEKKATKIIRSKIEEFKNKKFIFLSFKNISLGTIGILATKLSSKFKLPTFILQDKGDILRGSARSPGNINIYKVLKENYKLLEEFGGHKFACGFEIKRENVEKFINSLKKWFLKYKTFFDDKIEIDYKFKKNDIINENELIEILKYLSPFGKKNEQPLFIIENFRILKKEKKSKFLKFLGLREVNNNREYYDLIIFKDEILGYQKIFEINKFYDIVAKIKQKKYNGIPKIYFEVIDLKERKI